ncbi:MAG: hypothetical protein AAFQ41_01600 [Cyanobacteria bacterium J06623_7]
MHSDLVKTRVISSKQLLPLVLFIETVAIVMAIATAIKTGNSPFRYFDEGEFMTYFSCLQLLIISIYAGKIARQAKKSPLVELVKNAVFWWVVSGGLFYLALDDALSIHEEIDKSLHRLLGVQETLVTDLADDIIVGIYLLVALAYIVYQWQNLQFFRSSFNYFKIGFVLGTTMVAADILSNNTLFVSMVTEDSQLQGQLILYLGIFEEIAKTVAEGFFLVGAYHCWRQVKSIELQRDRQQESTVKS